MREIGNDIVNTSITEGNKRRAIKEQMPDTPVPSTPPPSPTPKDKNPFLTVEELLTISLNTEKLRAFEQDMRIIDLKRDLIKVQEDLLNSHYKILERDKIILEEQEKQVTAIQDKKKEESLSYLKEITEKHPSLKNKKWSYDPETGEIVINEDI